MGEEWRVHVERLDGRMNTVEARVDAHIKSEDSRWVDQEKYNDKIELKVDRPSWAVTVVITALSSLAVGLMVFVATHLQ